jgi:hypothetical protein
MFARSRVGVGASFDAFLDEALGGYPDPLKRLIANLLRWDPSARIGAQAALESGFFDGWEAEQDELTTNQIHMAEIHERKARGPGRFDIMRESLATEELQLSPPPFDLCV